METGSIIYEKSYNFARRMIKLYKFLIKNNEFISSKQILRSGTSIGANIAEANYAISKKDFKNKMSIALKESKDENYISSNQYKSLIKDLEEIIKILVKIVKNAS